MAFHLEGPWLSTTGKRKGKQKFRNSEEARKARELAEDWADLQKKWGIESTEKKRKRAMKAEPLVYTLTAPPGRSTSNHIASRNTGDGIAASKATQQYTGTKMLGIGVMHKSNSVPIFSDQEAIEIATMRRG